MVRQVIKILLAFTLSVIAFAIPTSAASYDVYPDGNLSSTYVTYFKDIVSGIGLTDDYVAFRSGQYTYSMAVGDIEYSNNYFTGTSVKIYEFDTESSGYNSTLNYDVRTEKNFEVFHNGKLLYSNLGEFPQLVERGSIYAILQTIIICIMCLSFVINRIFNFCLRGLYDFGKS